jgi:hypothetical protein
MNFDQRVAFLEGILAVPCANQEVRLNLLERVLRLLSDVTDTGLVFRYTIGGSPAAAEHVRQLHGGDPTRQCGRNCGDGALDRAHAVSVKALARQLADGEIPERGALERLGHAVLLTKDEHGQVDHFETRERLEYLLGAPLVPWL